MLYNAVFVYLYLYGLWPEIKSYYYYNIFTSDVTSHIQSGLLINDTSDHLPIFQMTDVGINGNFVYNKKRIVPDRNICEIISELEKTEWDEILNSDDVNVSYETFVNKLTDIYRKSVLLSQVR